MRPAGDDGTGGGIGGWDEPTVAPTDGPVGADRAGGLRAEARVGGRWGLLVAVLQQLGSVVATLVLARRLLPIDFGIVALTYSVIALVRVVTDAGLGTALVVRETVERSVESSTFWLAVIIGSAATAIAVLLAGSAARLGGVPAAAPYIAVSSSQILLSLVLSVVRGVLLRGLRYRLVYGAEAAGLLTYVSVQIVLALTTDLGAWVVVIGWVADSLVTAVVLAVGARWRPAWHMAVSDIRSDLKFNATYTGAAVANSAAKNIDNWFVGRTMGATPLGNYYIAFALPNILRQRLTTVVSQVMLPILRRIEQTSQRHRVFLAYTQMVAFVAVPALVGIAVLADPVVRLFFGPKWLDAIPPLRIVALAATCELLTALSIPVFLAARCPGKTFRVNVARLGCLGAGLAVVGLGDGSLQQVAAAVLVSAFTAAAVSIYDVCRLTGLRVGALAGALVPVVVAVVTMAAAVAGVDRALGGAAPVLRLTVGAAVGAATYLATGLVGFRDVFRPLIREAWRFAGGGRMSSALSVN